MKLRETSDKIEPFNTSISTLGIMSDTALVSLSKGCNVGIQQVLGKICPIYAKMNECTYPSSSRQRGLRLAVSHAFKQKENSTCNIACSTKC